MSLFGALLGDFEDDGYMGNQINSMNMQMRNMNRFMNNMMMPDPFNMLTPFDGGFNGNNSMMERVPMLGGGLFGFPGMPNMNRLISTDIGNNGASFCSSSVISMSSGPDGRPQIYQATSSTKTGPGGIRETRKTVQDSSSGVKKMAIGHHIGERAHIIEKEQNLRSGQHEERQEFINLDEEEAESFDREFTNKARMHTTPSIMSGGGNHSPHHRQYQRALPALPAPPSANTRITSTSSSTSSTQKATEFSSASAATTTQNTQSSKLSSASVRRTALRNASMATPRRPLRTPSSSPLALTTSGHSSTSATISVHPHPYNNAAARRNFRSKHTKHQQQHQEQLSDEQNQQQQQHEQEHEHDQHQELHNTESN
ncbi:myeloid leukemia factor isoform X2 [Episyrphus balteatus]|uniref:myeloid leukemia factor isoform X2 n=1 Tax=Episyrphus balteatus TaxID=286459 RepID=UPI0024857E8B|nr:myeloid leukemia factor isoform X2 [Episyrphus balteatus]